MYIRSATRGCETVRDGPANRSGPAVPENAPRLRPKMQFTSLSQPKSPAPTITSTPNSNSKPKASTTVKPKEFDRSAIGQVGSAKRINSRTRSDAWSRALRRKDRPPPTPRRVNRNAFRSFRVKVRSSFGCRRSRRHCASRRTLVRPCGGQYAGPRGSNLRFPARLYATFISDRLIRGIAH